MHNTRPGPVVRSYALDAVEIPGTASPLATPDAVATFLRQVATATVTAFPGVGMGQAIRLRGPKVVGAGLMVDDLLVHLAAFRQENRGPAGEGQRAGGIRRASRRLS